MEKLASLQAQKLTAVDTLKQRTLTAGPGLILLPRTLHEIEVTQGIKINLAPNASLFGLRGHYRETLQDIYRDINLRSVLIDEIDAVTRQESVAAATQSTLSMDILIVGTGPSGVSVACAIREKIPHATIWMADNRPYRGGQFADPGLNYQLNSPDEGESLGFPGELDGPNNLGGAAILQTLHISDDEFPFRSNVANVLKINSFLVAPAITDLDVTSYTTERDADERYKVIGYHSETDRTVVLNPKILIFATGQGTPKYGIDTERVDTAKALVTRQACIFNSETFRTHLEELSPTEILGMVENNMAFIGGRDSANIALEGIIAGLSEILSPSEIKKLRINVYGAKYGDAQEFQSTIGTHRYDILIPFIGNLIQPHTQKAAGIFEAEAYKVGLEFDTKEVSQRTFGTIVFSTGYDSNDIESMSEETGNDKIVYEIIGADELASSVVAKQIGEQDIYIIGTAVNEQYDGKPPRFARSIRKHTPRVTALADKVVNTIAV